MEMEPLPETDVISNLPGNIIEAILTFLPIRDAVRTSILSLQWRNKWTTIPQLVFNEECVPPPSGNIESDQLKCVKIVDRVLLLHSGPIHKFKCSGYLRSSPYIDGWILFLSNHGIKEFTLDCLDDDFYKVPSCLFSCQDLTCLELTNCIITPPPTFSGFPHLTSLFLVNSYAYEHLLYYCPLLERLKLSIYFPTPDHLQIFGHLQISGLNLRQVSIRGNFSSLWFEDTPLLTTVNFYTDFFIDYATGKTEQRGSYNLIEVLGHLHSIHTLTIHYQYFLVHLEEGNDDPFEAGEIAYNAEEGILTRLRTVHITGIRGANHEFELVKFILANATLLCSMAIYITTETEVEESWILKELIQFRRASAQATIYVQSM